MAEPFVAQLSQAMASQLEQDLILKGFEITHPQYTIFQAKGKGISVTLYASLKLVVQGKEMRDFIEFYLEPEILKTPLYTHKSTLMILNQDTSPKIGSDEAGKGDFFGPLVVASVCSRGESDIMWLVEAGVKDSKLLKDEKICKIAKSIETRLPYEVLVLRPEKYNELYTSFSNLNDLLAWCHAQTISSLLKRVETKKILVDKFASEWVLKRALARKVPEKTLDLEQRVRGEEDIVVAAASILARAYFVKEMEKLGEKLGIELPKGASQKVITTGRKIVKKYSSDVLLHLAKWHFSTTQKVLGIDESHDTISKSP